MKAIAIERFGGLDELKAFDLPKPEPAPDEVLIRVRAAGVGTWDASNRTGEYLPSTPHFPMILGAECAGDIERVGSKVTTLREKQAVYSYFTGPQGAYAQYVAVKAEFVAEKPKSLSYIEAAGVPVDAITAHQAIVDGLKLAAGQWLFIAGGAGGVGNLAVQIATTLGAHVIVSAKAEDFEYLESLGVAKANLIDYKRSDVAKSVRDLTGGKGADLALDAVGGPSSKETIQAVKDGGTIAVLTVQELPAERQVRVVHVSSKPSGKRLELIAAMFDAGQLKVHVAKVFPLAKAREAQALVTGPHDRGEIVISVD